MVGFIPLPDPSSLLPPLLACLPTAFASPRPPPAVLPLLSPILRQRVQLLSVTAASQSESWLHLLCWEPSEATQLAKIVEGDGFEPHPVSGEIELGDVRQSQYRRLDEETLQSRLEVSDLGLAVIYVWCQGEGESGWRVSELRPVDANSQIGSHPWWESIKAANENVGGNSKVEAHKAGVPTVHTLSVRSVEDDQEDDDDYWAQYDNTPARTPAPKHPAAPMEIKDGTGHVRTSSEAEYYAQYSQVQPEMDNDDPFEDRQAIGQSSLGGNTITGSLGRPAFEEVSGHSSQPSTNEFDHSIVHTRPSSSTSSISVSRLEQSAAKESHAEVAVQQHISTSLKSLFRLARGAGIEREEFERLVRVELDTMDMMTEDD